MNPRTAEQWLHASTWLESAKDVPAIVAKEIRDRAAKAIKKAKPYKAPIRVRRAPKVEIPQVAKRDIRAELEAYCKAVVFTRDCGAPEAREGSCITCGQWRVLQWGHFIPQQKSKWLQYDPRNTGGQCSQCNGPGHGETFKYGMAIDARDGVGAAAALQREADAHKFWRPNKYTLQEKLNELRRHYPLPSAPTPTPGVSHGKT